MFVYRVYSHFAKGNYIGLAVAPQPYININYELIFSIYKLYSIDLEKIDLLSNDLEEER